MVIAEDLFEDKPEAFTTESTEDIFPDLSDKSSDTELPVSTTEEEAGIFEDVKPFNDMQLFTDKIDDGSEEEETVSKNISVEDKDIDEMPDAFWVTQSEDEEETLESEPKVRKLSA